MAQERTREPEPREKEREALRFAGRDWNTRINRTEERKYLAALPRVIRCSDSPRNISPSWSGSDSLDQRATQGGVAVHLRWYRNDYQRMEAPIHTIACLGGRSAGHEGGYVVAEGEPWPPTHLRPKHRHFFEAAFYVPGGGKVFEYQDGRTWEFQGEGILCVPTFTQHMHWYYHVPAGGITFQSRLFEFLGLGDFEHFELNKKWLEAMGDEGKAPEWLPMRYERLESFVEGMRQVEDWGGEEPKTTYDRYLQHLVQENHGRRESPRWVSAQEMPWEDTRQGRIKYLSHPWPHPWGNCALRTFDIFLQELPPGGKSGIHRHVGEEVHYILRGKGYDIQDGERYDWEEDNIVCIPNYTVHQHVNADPHEPALFVAAQTRWYMYAGYGGIEQLENAP